MNSNPPKHSGEAHILATKAFQILGRNNFEVSANLSESLRNFGKFQSILLMAYQQGQADASATKLMCAENACCNAGRHSVTV